MSQPPSLKTRGLPAERRPTSTEQRFELLVLSGAEAGRSLPLSGSGPVRIGSAEENELVLDDDTVSRQHAVLVPEREGWLLKDLKSTNGSFIDSAKVREGFVRPGATLRLGQVQLRLSIVQAALQLAPSRRDRFGSVVGTSLRMREVFAVLERAVGGDSTVLLTGETGVGKGAIARALHEESHRARGPFVVVDCGAISPTLIESELFGHEKGAFTGAAQRRLGALELAKGGTLLLDELDDLRKDLQPKLLRALEERSFQRLGSGQAVPFDARVIAATKKELRQLVVEGAFREDLYFRIAVLRIDLPALRERLEDLPMLVDRFGALFGHPGAWSSLAEPVRQRLSAHSWPGNVRELRNAVERAFSLADPSQPQGGPWILEAELRPRPAGADLELPFKKAKEQLVDAFEREYLEALLRRSGGRLGEAARLAQIDRKHLYNLMQKHGLSAPE